ncbi:MAG: VWA domain-containing protein [Syntrophomonas sp.]
MAGQYLATFVLYRVKKFLWGLPKYRLRTNPRPPRDDEADGQLEGRRHGENQTFEAEGPEEAKTVIKPVPSGALQAGLDGGKLSSILPDDLDLSTTDEAGRLIKKLVTSISRRRKQGHKRKTIDVRATIHHNLQYGGTLLKMRWRMKKPGRPRVLLIMDSSSSMIPSAKMMLQFLYALQHELRRFEVFIFGNNLNYVTPYLNRDFKELIGEVSRLPQWNFSGTELWRPLAQLEKDYSHLLTGRTVVILLTDCQFYEKFFALAPLNNLRRKVKRLYIFNPDPRTRNLEDKYYQETISGFKKVIDRMFYTQTIHEVAASLRQIMT